MGLLEHLDIKVCEHIFVGKNVQGNVKTMIKGETALSDVKHLCVRLFCSLKIKWVENNRNDSEGYYKWYENQRDILRYIYYVHRSMYTLACKTLPSNYN